MAQATRVDAMRNLTLLACAGHGVPSDHCGGLGQAMEAAARDCLFVSIPSAAGPQRCARPAPTSMHAFTPDWIDNWKVHRLNLAGHIPLVPCQQMTHGCRCLISVSTGRSRTRSQCYCCVLTNSPC